MYGGWNTKPIEISHPYKNYLLKNWVHTLSVIFILVSVMANSWIITSIALLHADVGLMYMPYIWKDKLFAESWE